MAEWITNAPRRFSATTRVAASVTAVQLIATAKERYGVILHNDSLATCYYKLGAGAAFVAAENAGNSFTSSLAPAEKVSFEAYCGVITAVWTAATGACMVTELTA